MHDGNCYFLLVPYWTPNVPRSLTESRGTYEFHTSKNVLHISGEKLPRATEYTKSNRNEQPVAGITSLAGLPKQKCTQSSLKD